MTDGQTFILTAEQSAENSQQELSILPSQRFNPRITQRKRQGFALRVAALARGNLRLDSANSKPATGHDPEPVQSTSHPHSLFP
jgi:hypothetical protein